MVWAASTVIALGAAGAAGVGAIAASSASGKAAGAQANAANQANATQQEQYYQTRTDQLPWRSAGSNALNRLNVGLGLTTSAPARSRDYFDADAYLAANPDVAQDARASADPYAHYVSEGIKEGRMWFGNDQYKQELANSQAGSNQAGFGDLNRKFTQADFQADPGYQFRMDEGARGMNNSAAARGGVLSGAALKAATKYSQNFASNEYGNSYNRFNTDQTNQFNRLASIAGVGQQANNQVATAGVNMANNVSQNQLAIGNAQASGYIGSSNALNGGVSNAFNMYQQQQFMNKIGNKTGAAGGSTTGTSWSPYGTGVSDSTGFDGYDFRE